jgi:hypothetical protein
MKKLKVIGFVGLVVLGLSTISCSKDELVEDLCIDKVAATAYNIETNILLAQDEENDAGGRYTYLSYVCGCNGKTYFNDHQAKLEGVISFTKGSCK